MTVTARLNEPVAAQGSVTLSGGNTALQATLSFQAGVAEAKLNQTVSNFWSASVTQSGKDVTAVNASYNNAVSPGQSTAFGFQAGYSGTNTAPTLSCTAT